MIVPDTAHPVIEATGLEVQLEGRKILQDVGFSLAPGRLIGIVGPNGSGKTTLMRTLGGAIPYSGSLTLDGREVRSWHPRQLARHLAFVRQIPALTFDFTVEELVLLGRSAHKGWLETYDRSDRQFMERVLSDVGLAGFESRSVLKLSGGELQRAFLAQALAQDARLLLLDEPTAHLDVHYQFDLMQRLTTLSGAGYTVVVVLHDLELAARFTEYLLVMDAGRIRAAGPPEEVLTAELVAAIFHMDALLEQHSTSGFRITYLRPLGSHVKQPTTSLPIL